MFAHSAQHTDKFTFTECAILNPRNTDYATAYAKLERKLARRDVEIGNTFQLHCLTFPTRSIVNKEATAKKNGMTREFERVQTFNTPQGRENREKGNGRVVRQGQRGNVIRFLAGNRYTNDVLDARWTTNVREERLADVLRPKTRSTRKETIYRSTRVQSRRERGRTRENAGERARRQHFIRHSRHRLFALRRHAKRRDTRHSREQSLVGIFFSKKVPILMTFSRNVSLKPVLRHAPRHFSRVQQDSRSRPSIGWSSWKHPSPFESSRISKNFSGSFSRMLLNSCKKSLVKSKLDEYDAWKIVWNNENRLRECCSNRRSFFRRFIFLIVLPNSDFIA